MIEGILEAIDRQIAELQKARSILAGSEDRNVNFERSRRGRPKGSKNAPKTELVKAKRTLSAEGKARIAEAQRKRHALRKRVAKKAAEGAA